MVSDYEPIDAPQPRGRRRWVGLLLALLLAFAAGLAVMLWVETRWSGALPWQAQPAAPSPAVVAAGSMPPQPARIAAPATPVVADAGAIDRRLEALDARIVALDARVATATGNADRAEAMLVAFAARRALDGGVQLGYLEGLLRERFGGSQPQAVAVILSAARQPVTLDALATGLAEAAPALSEPPADEGWWDGIRRELASLVVIRRANTPSAAPVDRLARAERQLESGNVDAALAEVARLPTRDAAAGWIAKARRYVAARRALDRIETAALLAPRPPAILYE